MPSEKEPSVFRVTAPSQCILCPICFGKTHRHDTKVRRFRHGYAWHLGAIWIELAVPRQRCTCCGFTFTHDYGLGLIRSSTDSFRREIVRRCHGRSLSDVAREYDISYTTLERWFYTYAPEQLLEEKAQHLCVDEFATRKRHSYATSVSNADTGRILTIVPHRDQTAIASALAKVTGKIQTVVSDFVPAMAKAIHVLDRFHLIQFFTEALRRRRRYLSEAKKHHHVPLIDCCLARCPSNLTEEERGFVAQWCQEDRASEASLSIFTAHALRPQVQYETTN